MECDCVDCGFRGMELCEHRKAADELAAHKREVAELKRELELTRQQRNRARLDAQEKFGSEVAELREILTELARAADTAFSAISACGKLIGASDVSDSVYRNRLLERVAKMLKAQEGAKNEGK